MPHKGIVLNSDIVFTSIGIVNCTKKSTPRIPVIFAYAAC